MKRLITVGICCAAAVFSVAAQVYTGTNAPDSSTNFIISVGAATTNLSFTVGGSSTSYSHLMLKKGSAPTDAVYDYSSRDIGTNGIYLELPEVTAGTYYVRVRTPAQASAHSFTLVVETNRAGLRTLSRPVSKPLNSLATGLALSGSNDFFKVELLTNTAWRVSLDSTNQNSPDLYVNRDQPPTTLSYLKRSLTQTNDVLAFTAAEGRPAYYYIGALTASAPPGGAAYTLRISAVVITTLTWDPGLTHLGTQVYSNLSGIADDYFFRITTANPSLSAWRTALRMLTTNDANLYLSRGALPTPTQADFKSERAGSDGVVLGTPASFLPSEDWYLLVRSKAGATWTLVSGSPFVTDLGTVATNASSGSGDMEVGPEGMRFFSATAGADMLAWRLWLNGLSNNILVKKTSLPLQGAAEQAQAAQMLLVPPYLGAGQYLIGVPGAPGTIINLDSRQHSVQDLAYGSSTSASVAGFGYTTYRVKVPAQQIAWQMYLPSTNGNPNFSVRRSTVPNESYNDAYSELIGTNVDNITLVPQILSDETFYITVYCTNVITTNTHNFTLQNGPATVTDVSYRMAVTNDEPNRVGWRFYRVTDINQQLGSLGWDLFLTNFTPGTRLALRKNAAPSLWSLRNPSPVTANYYDVLSAREFLQHPDHQADIWYIGVYNPTNNLGPFVLTTQDLLPQTLTENVLLSRTNMDVGKWDFFRVVLTPEDVAGLTGPGPVMGWDVRLTNISSGTPRLIIRRDKLPTSALSTLTTSGTSWPSGQQWMAGSDWTKRTFSADGLTNEDGRILAIGIDRPLEPGTYYIGVTNTSGTNAVSFDILSRWIGPGRTIPLVDLPYNGGRVTNQLAPREAAYYRVVAPPGSRSWKVKMTPLNGEAMLLSATNRMPSIDSEKRVQKAGKEQYVLLPVSGDTVAGTNFLLVAGEGTAPLDNNKIGTGNTTYVLESLGQMPEIDLGYLSGADLTYSGTLEGGESTAFHFETFSYTLGYWLTLGDVVGNPWIVARGGNELIDPGLGGDLYGNEGGRTGGAAASPTMIVAANPSSVQTVMVKARGLGGLYPDANYTMRVQEILPDPVPFDGGTFEIVNRPVGYESFFYIDVAPNAWGWDLRITNVTSGSPQLIVSKDVLPIFRNSTGWLPVDNDPTISTYWPSAARWGVGADATQRLLSPSGTNESGRVLSMGIGRPLQPGRYYVGVMGSGIDPVSCTLVSRGIGPAFSIPVTDLAFSGGESSVTGLAPRETAYFRVLVPTNAPNWRVRLLNTSGESLLTVLKDSLPNIGAQLNSSATNSGGRKMQRIGNESFLMLPLPGQDRIAAGYYYLAVVSEGQTGTNTTQIGVGTSSFTIQSLGAAPVTFLGDVGATDLIDETTLDGGDTRIYQFRVPAEVETVEARLENRVGNPVMALEAGSRIPDPSAGNGLGTVGPDFYGTEAGESPGPDVQPALLSIPNPTNGIYTLVVKARGITAQPGIIANAGYTLRISAAGTVPVPFDHGTAVVQSQAPLTWRYFRIDVPTNCFGWDLRLINVSSGLPRLVVRRGSLPPTLTTTPWSTPGKTTTWPADSQWAPLADATRRSYSVDGSVNEDGRVLAMGLTRPLEPGTYFVGVINSAASTNMSYTLSSRGIGMGYSIPVIDLPFIGSVTNSGLAAREIAYYRVVVPSNTPSWKAKLEGKTGEAMLAVLRDALPNLDTINSAGTVAGGKSMQKLGNEHFVLLPGPGQTNIASGTNYLAVISEGVNPGATSRVGPGNSAFVLRSLGTMPVLDLGMVTSEDLVSGDSLEGGEARAYQFTVPWGTYGVKLQLENRVNNPVLVACYGDKLPDPGSSAPGSADPYGNEGGYAASDGHATIATLANPLPGTYSVVVKARAVLTSYPDASYTLRVQELLAPELNFADDMNTNGLSNEFSGLLQDNERAFFKINIPPTYNGLPVIGWKLDLVQSSGSASMRVRRDALPSDATASTQMPFATASAVIAPPYLTNGTWFVEVKATGSTAYTLRSNPLRLQRPTWTMPLPGQPNSTPGVILPLFGDTGIDTNGLPLPGDQGIILEQGSLHYYAVEVPEGNVGLLRAQLEAISGNPDLYLRAGAVPTLYHNTSGTTGTIYDRSMLASSGTEYANWVPLDGKLESQLKPGLWYLAVRAAGNANATYRLRVSVGSITDLPIHGPGVTNQIIAGGDWRYYRVTAPTALPLNFTVTFGQDSGDVVMHLRDTVPPGNGKTGDLNEIKDWKTDLKSSGTYQSYDPPDAYTFSAPPVRPGASYYVGFRALNDAAFNVRVTTNGAPAHEPTVVPFYGGSASAVVGPLGSAVFRVDVPPEATRWKHVSTHATNLIVYLEQGTLPTRTAPRWTGTGSNSFYQTLLVTWNDSLKQYVQGSWPWVPGQSYFLLVTNPTPAVQDFTLTMDGKNAQTDDSDNDSLPDSWELLYFGSLFQIASADTDKDGIANLDEWLEGTNPNDSNSFRARLLTSASFGTIQRQPDLASYPLGSTVILTPIPASGYAFIGWGGQASGLDNPLPLSMDGHKNLVAYFKRAGDDFITALPLSGTALNVNASNVSFTKETGEPFHAGNPGGKSIWWKWVAPSSGPISLSTAGSAFNTLLAVYTGTAVNGLSLVASDNNSTGGTNRSFVNFAATAGTPYMICVDGYNAASGKIVLSLNTGSVVVQPRIGSLGLVAGGSASFILQAQPNTSYLVQYSENLADWHDVGTVITSGDGTVPVLDPAAQGKNVRFYRARLP